MKTENEVKTTIENNVAEDVTPEKKKLSKKSKIIISIVSIVVVLAIIITSCFIWQNQNIKLISNTKTIEYGEKYIPNLSDFVEEKNVNKYSIDGNIPNEEGKDYPAIGEYKLTVKKNKKSEEVTVKVKDTIAPTFAEDTITTISTTLNTPLDDVTEMFKDKVTDLDDIKVTLNSANVNYAQAGEYKSELVATDESGNTSQKQITVTVTENNGTETPETVTEASGNLPNNNNTTTGISNQGNSSNNKKPSGSSNSKPSSGSSSKPTKPSNSGNSGSSSQPSKPSTGGTTSGTTTKPTHCTNNGNHSMSCGNMGRWFNSRKEVENYTSSERQKWKNKYLNGEISWEEYTKKAPCGYECWSCSYCGKWTGNFKYD